MYVGKNIVFRQELDVGTVPTFNLHHIGTVPMFNLHNVGTLPMSGVPIETLRCALHVMNLIQSMPMLWMDKTFREDVEDSSLVK